MKKLILMATICLFSFGTFADSKMEIFEEAEETPVIKLCKEVRKIMDEHLNDTSFDTTQCFLYG